MGAPKPLLELEEDVMHAGMTGGRSVVGFFRDPFVSLLVCRWVLMDAGIRCTNQSIVASLVNIAQFSEQSVFPLA